MFLENYQLNETGDTRASALYELITSREGVDETTPMLKVRIVIRLNSANNRVATEHVSFEVAESQFTNMQVLADHYLASYGTLHIMNDTFRTLQAAVIPTHSILTIEVIGERVERDNDDEQRRSKFRGHNVGHQGSSWLTGGKGQERAVSEGGLDLFVDG